MPFLQAAPAPETDVLAMLPIGTTHLYAKGQVVYEGQPERVYRVVTGRVLTYIVAPHRNLNLQLVLPGDLFGLVALEQYQGVGSAKALEQSIITSWPIAVIWDSFYDIPTLGMEIVRALTRESEHRRMRLKEMSFKVEQRFAMATGVKHV